MDVLGDVAFSRFLIALPRLAGEVGDDGREEGARGLLRHTGVPKRD